VKHLDTIVRFGWPYLQRYWPRLTLGMVLGICFGISNAAILGAAKTVLDRLDPNAVAMTAPAVDKSAAPLPKSAKQIQQSVGQIRQSLNETFDPWLPAAGRPLDARQIAGLLLLIPLLVAARGFIGYFSSYFLAWVAERVINDMRLDVLIKLNSLSLDYFNRSTMGDLTTRVNGDTLALYRALHLGLSDLIKEPVTVLAMISYLFFLDWKLALFVLLFFPLCGVPIVVLGRKVRRASQGGLKASILQSSLLFELLSSIRVVKAFCLEDQQTERFRAYSKEQVHHGVKSIQAKELINPILETIAAVGLGVLIIWIFHTGRSLTDMVVFLGGVLTVFTPVKKLSALHVLFEQASVGVERLVRILGEQPSVKEPPPPATVGGFQKEFTFENVSFSYGSQPVLENLSLTIPRGYRLGVAGESGSGKSTLVNLVFRFYDPTQGAVKLDGVSLRDIATVNLRAQMALVSQEVVIFDQSVAENIACGKPGATRAEVEAAARAAYAHEFILQLPQGYETRLGERGVTLSGGQRQRVAIARAFIRNAPILVLDEATAQLDSQSEAEVQVAIDRLAENRTVISVAHRLSTLANMDKIIVLAKGRLVEQGTFAELVRAGGPFAMMAAKQGIFPGR